MKYHFGDKIREIRERKQLTLKEVAGRAALSESLISQIERNRISPAIDTLLKIVDILDIDLNYIFSDFKKERSIHLVRASERNKLVMDNVIYEQLSRTVSTEEEHEMEAYFLEIPVGAEKGSREYGHPGKELGVIIEGEGEFQIGTKTYALSAGDSISFSADAPHGLKNTGKISLKAFWVTTPPKQLFGSARQI
jgi:transcriptional regulator with XRE-family HTH domain